MITGPVRTDLLVTSAAEIVPEASSQGSEDSLRGLRDDREHVVVKPGLG
jgi:hypothetical protein